MKKKLLMGLSALVLLACNKPENTLNNSGTNTIGTKGAADMLNVKVNGDHLKFEDEKAYVAALENFDKAESTEQKNWERYPFSSLHQAILSGKIEETSPYNNFPPAHQFLLNKDGIVEVGDQIIWYNMETKYYISVEKYKTITSLNDIPREAERTGLFITFVGSKNQEQSNNGRYFDAFFDGRIGTGGDQKEWYPTPGDGDDLRKYITEFVGTYETISAINPMCGSATIIARLYVGVKCEWRSRKGWRPAGDPRIINYNLSCTNLQFSAFPPCMSILPLISVPSTYVSQGNTTITSDHWRVLASHQGIYRVDAIRQVGKWYGNITGTVFQDMTNAGARFPYTVTFN